MGRGGAGHPERQRHGQVVRGRGDGQAITREWRRPGLSPKRKRTPDWESRIQKTPRDNAE